MVMFSCPESNDTGIITFSREVTGSACFNLNLTLDLAACVVTLKNVSIKKRLDNLRIDDVGSMLLEHLLRSAARLTRSLSLNLLVHPCSRHTHAIGRREGGKGGGGGGGG